MDPDGRNQSEDDQTFDISQFGPPRTGSSFEPVRLGSLFGWGRAKKPPAAATEPNAEPPTATEAESGFEAVSPQEPIVVEPASSAADETEIEVLPEAELEPVQPNESEPSLMNEFENESQDEVQRTTEPVVVVKADETHDLKEQPDQEPEQPLEVEVETTLEAELEPKALEIELEPALEAEVETALGAELEPSPWSEPALEAPSEFDVEVEAEVAEKPHELLAVVEVDEATETDDITLAAVATGPAASDELDEAAQEEQPEAEVIQMASYVEHDEGTEDKLANNEADEADGMSAEVIDLDAEPETTDFEAEVIDLATAETEASEVDQDETEVDADVIDLEFEDSNVINLAAQQNGAAISSLPLPETEIETVEVVFELEADSPEAEFESDLELVSEPAIEVEADLQSTETVSDNDEFVAEDDLGADTESDFGPEHDLDIESDNDLDIEPDGELETEAEVGQGSEIDLEADLEAEPLGAEVSDDIEEPFGVEDDSPAIPMYSVGAAIELLDTASDEADELLDSEDSGVADFENDAEPETAADVDAETEIEIDLEAEVGEANTGVITNDESEAPEVPGMPSLEDLRTMALDLDDIDAVLERLDSDPDSLDLDVPPVEQTLDLTLSE